jgi:hypothetical protein
MTANKTVRRPATRSTSPARKTRPARPTVSKTAARATRPVKAAPRVVKAVFTPLADGQIWQMGEANLKVEMVGKLLVHYKLAKPNAVRTPTSIAGITTLVKFMKKSKAVLIQGQTAPRTGPARS